MKGEDGMIKQNQCKDGQKSIWKEDSFIHPRLPSLVTINLSQMKGHIIFVIIYYRIIQRIPYTFQSHNFLEILKYPKDAFQIINRNFILLLQQKLKKIKLTMIRNQSQIRDKKKLNLRSLSRKSLLTNIKFQRPQQKQDQFLKNHLLSKNQYSQQMNELNHSQQKILKNRSLRRLTEMSDHKKLFSKSLEKQNNKRMTINRKCQNSQKIRISQPYALTRNQGKRLSIVPKGSSEKRDFKVIQLLNFCQNNLTNGNGSSTQEQDFTENSLQSDTMKKHSRHSVKNVECNKNSCFYRFQSAGLDKLEEKRYKDESGKFSSFEINLTLTSKVAQICIPPWNKSLKKVNQQVQTIQSQTEFFQYLVYKRKKDQYQKELIDLFNDISIVKQDRNQFQQRKDSVLSIYNQEPQDEREKRIYQLKKDLDQLEQVVKTGLNETLKKEEVQQKQIQQIEMKTLSGLTKIDQTIKNYLSVFKQAFQKYEDPKYSRIVDRLQNFISNILIEVNRQINYHMKISKSFKQQSIDLKHIFNEFWNSNHEYKQLLKNCFQHLKKTPELCLELFGQKSPEMEINLDLINENHEFQKPKCVHCFNSKWKLHTVVEQNILMKSVLKVSQELLK